MAISPPARHEHLLSAARASRPVDRLRPADHLIRAATADAVRHVRPGGAEDAFAYLYGLDSLYGAAPDALTVLRAATGPASTATAGGAAELVQTALGDFITTLAPASAAASLFRLAQPLTLDRVGSLFLPSIDTAATAHWVQELEPIPATGLAVSNVQLQPRKLGALAGLSAEMLKRSSAEAAVRWALSEAAAVALDVALFDAEAASDSRPAGLRFGVSPIVGMGGADQVAVIADITTAVAAVSAVAGGQIALIMRPARAVVLSIMAPQIPLTILTSAHIPEGTIVAVAVNALAVAVGQIEIDSSFESTIHMSDEPLPISDGGTADPVRSYWQTDSVVIRLLMEIGWVLRAAGGVAVVEGVSW